MNTTDFDPIDILEMSPETKVFLRVFYRDVAYSYISRPSVVKCSILLGAVSYMQS